MKQAFGVKLEQPVGSTHCSTTPNSALPALPANKQQTRFKVITKAFKIQVTGRRKQGEKRLKVLINYSLGQPNNTTLTGIV